jgi:uncharacterized protein YbaR (Trm112 family)
MLDQDLLDLLACPSCHGQLRYEPDRQRLVCSACRLAYPIQDDIPILLREEARPLDVDSSSGAGQGT